MVEVTRPAVDPWECDDCMKHGDDFQDMQDHVSLTGHLLYTAL